MAGTGAETRQERNPGGLACLPKEAAQGPFRGLLSDRSRAEGTALRYLANAPGKALPLRRRSPWGFGVCGRAASFRMKT
jgi:hypothetical protein